jgi:Bacterial regulatory protein, arsR family
MTAPARTCTITTRAKITPSNKKNRKKTKMTLISPFSLPILSGIAQGRRPCQIAKERKLSQQAIYHHTKAMRREGLIQKQKAYSGIAWCLTTEGKHVLKELNISSMRKHDASKAVRASWRLIRLHDVAFLFHVFSLDEGKLGIKWSVVNENFCHVTIDDNIEGCKVVLQKASGRYQLIVYPEAQYFKSKWVGFAAMYDKARRAALKTGQRLNTEVSDEGRLVKKPHIAYERDIVATEVTASETAEIPVGEDGGKAWYDASMGYGELETDDPDYDDLALSAPIYVFQIRQDVEELKKQLLGYDRCYSPYSTWNDYDGRKKL